MTLKETGKCSLCGGTYSHYGNNPEPLGKFEDRCCDSCNSTQVIPARLFVMEHPEITSKSLHDLADFLAKRAKVIPRVKK